MGKDGIEAYHEGGQWKSRRQGRERAFDVGGTKKEQTAAGAAAARKDGVEHTIKNPRRADRREGLLWERSQPAEGPGRASAPS